MFFTVYFFYTLHIWAELRSFGFSTEFHSGAKNYKLPHGLWLQTDGMRPATQFVLGWKGALRWEECRKMRQLHQNNSRLNFHPIITAASDSNPFKEHSKAVWLCGQMA